MVHDITKLLFIAFQGKICVCFDRCNIYQEWNMCTFPYSRYDEIFNFKLFKIGKVKETDLIKVIMGDFWN